VLRRLKSFVALFTLLLLFSGGCLFYKQGNFHSITQDEAYRSAQLDRAELEYYIKKYNIKSILNLRGKNPDSYWYKEEISVSVKYNIAHYDVALSATKEPTEKDVKRLMEIFGSAPRPILIHCQFGADRSGLVAAMWKEMVDREPKSEAKRQLSFLYGHVPILGRDAMDRFLEKWNPAVQNSY
jgi:undecaprenyl-diphosphatase